jgi:hypothetical protein
MNSPGTGVRRQELQWMHSSRIDPMLFLRIRRASSDTNGCFDPDPGIPPATKEGSRGIRFNAKAPQFAAKALSEAVVPR